MVLPADVHTTQLVLREAHYYQLTGLIQLLEVQATRLKQRVAEVSAVVHCTALHTLWPASPGGFQLQRATPVVGIGDEFVHNTANAFSLSLPTVGHCPKHIEPGMLLSCLGDWKQHAALPASKGVTRFPGTICGFVISSTESFSQRQEARSYKGL